MKSSLYNTFLRVTDSSTVIYNALEDKTLVCKGEITPDNILSQSNLLNQKLEQQGFIVPDSVDEYSLYTKKAKEAEDDPGSFHLLINPTINCNFKCWYCYESHVPSQMNNEVIARIKKLITQLFLEGRNLTISFFGGEPMLYSKQVMVPILDYAISEAKRYGRNFSSNMTSNGYLLNDQIVRELSDFNFTGGQITLDGDKEHHNSVRFHKKGEDTFTKIINNLHLMVKAGMSVTLRINCTKDNLNSLLGIPKAFEHFTKEEKSRIHADLHIVWQESSRQEIYQELDKVAELFNKNGIPTAKMDFTGFCYGDKRNSCVINYNGDLYKCTAVDFHKTARDGFLTEEGSLVWENNSLEKRLASKFTNETCKSCRIFPLCHGGCTKQSLSSQKYCLHNYSDEEKDSVVTNRILFNSLFNNATSL